MRLIGKATFVGINGVVQTAELATTKTKVSDLKYSRKTPKVEVTDGNNNILSKAYADPQDAITVEAILLDDSGTPTQSGAQANGKLPLAGAVVTLSATGSTYFDGDWNYDGDGTVVPSRSDAWKLSLPLIRVGPPTNNIPSALAVIAP